tara:strand:+ start:51 stop:509 length:459 start_codon:yes stop_codon:yes gene_type:complete
MSYKSIIGAYSSNNVRESFYTTDEDGKTQKEIYDKNIHTFMANGGGFSPPGHFLCHYVGVDANHGQELPSDKLVCHPLLISPGHVDKYLRVGKFIDSNGHKHDKYILGNINDFRNLVSTDCEDISEGKTGTQYTDTTHYNNQCGTTGESNTS